ncbi:MAG: hypothetical protein Kow0059_01880 [Candidatus Sumerlaeia bacterium]
MRSLDLNRQSDHNGQTAPDRRPQPQRREWIGLGAALAIPPAVLMGPAVLTGQIPWFMDIVMQFYPARMAAAAAIHRGEFPFWNPYTSCGAPLWANPQWGLGWPGLWPFLAWPRAGVYTAVMAVHLWLGALGMGAWVRAAGLGRGAALGAGAFFLLNGFTAAHWAFGSYFFAMALAPWTMAVLEALRRDCSDERGCFPSRTQHPLMQRIAGRSLALGALGAGLLLVGAPQAVWLLALWFGLIIVCDVARMSVRRRPETDPAPHRPESAAQEHGGNTGTPGQPQQSEIRHSIPDIPDSRPTRPPRRSAGVTRKFPTDSLRSRFPSSVRYAVALLAAGLLAAGLAAPQLVPMLALLGELTRADRLPLWRVQTGTLEPGGLARALLGGTGFPEDANSTLYVGTFVLGLAAIGLVQSGRRRWPEVLALGVALGLTLKPLSVVFYHILPGYAGFHDPRRALLVAMPLVCFFAAQGGAALAGWPDVRFRRRLWGVIAALGVPGAVELALHWPAFRGFDFGRLPGAVAFGWLPCPPKVLPPILLVSFGVAAGLYMLILSFSPSFRTMPESKGRRLAAALGLLGALQMLVFTLARVDMKFVKAAEFYRPGEAVRRIAEAGAGSGRFFAYDPTLAYSYDYTRPGVAAMLMPNCGAMWGLRDAQGYDPAQPRRCREFFVNNGIGGRLYPEHFLLVQNPWAPALARLGVRWAVGDLTAFYPDLPRGALAGHAVVQLPLPAELPRRMTALAVSLGVAAEPHLPVALERLPTLLIVAVNLADGTSTRFAIAGPDAPVEDTAATVLRARVNRVGALWRVVAQIPLDPTREVAGITLVGALSGGLAQGAIVDTRVRVDLAETGHWRRVETDDGIALFENTLPLPPPGEEWTAFDLSRPPRGWWTGLAMFLITGSAVATVALRLRRCTAIDSPQGLCSSGGSVDLARKNLERGGRA